MYTTHPELFQGGVIFREDLDDSAVFFGPPIICVHAEHQTDCFMDHCWDHLMSACTYSILYVVIAEAPSGHFVDETLPYNL